MSRSIRRLPQAKRDLIELADYLAQDSLAASDRFLQAAEQAFEALAGMPEMAGVWETDNPALAGIRVWPIRGFAKFLIFYRPTAGGIEVIRVLHASRDIASIIEVP